jgi:hypothetical protein
LPVFFRAIHRLPVWRIERKIASDLALPAVAVLQEAIFVVVEFLAGLDGKFRVRPLDNGIDRAGFLTEAAVDAFDHVDIVAGGAAGAIVAARPGFNRDGLGGADRLAELAGDTALLAVWIAPLGVFAALSRRLRILLVRIIERRLRLEEIAHRQNESADEFGQENRFGCLVEFHFRLSLQANHIANLIAPCPRPSR